MIILMVSTISCSFIDRTHQTLGTTKYGTMYNFNIALFDMMDMPVEHVMYPGKPLYVEIFKSGYFPQKKDLTQF